MKFFSTIALLLLPLCVFAQQKSPLDDPEQEKKFYESIESTVNRYTDLLELDDWQIFYVDSILTHDYLGMMDELNELNRAKVSNADLFVKCQDRWQEKIYNAFQSVFNEEQWAKYLKTGAARDKKSRDKREAKRNQ